MLLKKRLRISSLAPLSASVSAFLSARWTISRMPLSSTCSRSSNTNIRLRIDTARSGDSLSMRLEHRRADAAIEAVEQLGHGAHAADAARCAWLPSVFSRCSMTDEMRVMTSGEISSRVAMRVSTSTRSSSGSELASCAACAGLRCARISAIVCGCSPRMNFESCCGSARSSAGEAGRRLERLDDAVEDAARHVRRRAS